MTTLDTAKAVLAKASLFDQSFATPDINIARAWAEALGDVDMGDALAAVTAHYSEPAPRRIMPGDVLAGVRKIRAERVRSANSGLLEPDDVNPDDVAAYLAAIRNRRQAVADGRTLEAVPLAPADPERVREYIEAHARALPAMPPAFPRNDERNKLAARSSLCRGGDNGGQG